MLLNVYLQLIKIEFTLFPISAILLIVTSLLQSHRDRYLAQSCILYTRNLPETEDVVTATYADDTACLASDKDPNKASL